MTQTVNWVNNWYREQNIELPLITIFIPYLLTARMDRIMNQEEGMDLEIIASWLNLLNVHSIKILDVHSPVATALIKNSYNVLPTSLYERVFYYLGGELILKDDKRTWRLPENIVFVATDASAKKRVEKAISNTSLSNSDILVAAKTRNSLNQIISYSLPGVENLKDKKAVIIDDICDGGRTFMEAAETILPYTKDITLVVTHGIFSFNSLEILSSLYKRIFTTDSYYTGESTTKLIKWKI